MCVLNRVREGMEASRRTINKLSRASLYKYRWCHRLPPLGWCSCGSRIAPLTSQKRKRDPYTTITICSMEQTHKRHGESHPPLPALRNAFFLCFLSLSLSLSLSPLFSFEITISLYRHSTSYFLSLRTVYNLLLLSFALFYSRIVHIWIPYSHFFSSPFRLSSPLLLLLWCNSPHKHNIDNNNIINSNWNVIIIMNELIDIHRYK